VWGWLNAAKIKITQAEACATRGPAVERNSTRQADKQDCPVSLPVLQCIGRGLYLEPAKICMLAAVTRRNHLALVQKPLPRLRPGWALIRVRLAGICNTDIEILRGYHNFHGTRQRKR
jgi:hypothetical protein